MLSVNRSAKNKERYELEINLVNRSCQLTDVAGGATTTTLQLGSGFVDIDSSDYPLPTQMNESIHYSEEKYKGFFFLSFFISFFLSFSFFLQFAMQCHLFIWGMTNY